jgi:SagB-type dehydrogenase family enzyme
MGIGDRFQEETKHHPGRLSGRSLDWARRPEVYKTYPLSERFDLPLPEERDMGFTTCLRERRSSRNFSSSPLTLEQLSFLLWASTGIRESRMGHDFRTAPSAGALYSVETYLCVNSVEGLEKGIYHYDIKHHSLELLKEGNCSSKVAFAALDQAMCSRAAAVFIWTSVFERTKWKYGERGYRYIYIDAGHIAENLALACVAEGLGCCHVGAIFDEVANELIEVDGSTEGTIYMTAVGRI